MNISGPLSVDGKPVFGTLSMEQGWIDVSTMTETRPDPSWGEADPAGHFHAWANDQTLPTLKSTEVHVKCSGGCGQDEGCEGYTSTEWRCLICDEEVFPRWIVNMSPPPRQMPGRQEWTAVVNAFVEQGKQVSIVAGRHFGIGVAVGLSLHPDSAVTTIQCGPMARRLTDQPTAPDRRPAAGGATSAAPQ